VLDIAQCFTCTVLFTRLVTCYAQGDDACAVRLRVVVGRWMYGEHATLNSLLPPGQALVSISRSPLWLGLS
jgi:hypothetical protein